MHNCTYCFMPLVPQETIFVHYTGGPIYEKIEAYCQACYIEFTQATIIPFMKKHNIGKLYPHDKNYSEDMIDALK